MAKNDDILSEIRLLNTKLYGENGFEGDIPYIKENIEKQNNYLNDHSKRITIIETLQKERNRPSKKLFAGYISGALVALAAAWKAFFGS